MPSIAQVTVDRRVVSHALQFDENNRSQWIDAAAGRSCFCIGESLIDAAWTIEVLLPNSNTQQVASYENLFTSTSPRYITTNAMCGLPIRFISSNPQVKETCWAIIKS